MNPTIQQSETKYSKLISELSLKSNYKIREEIEALVNMKMYPKAINKVAELILKGYSESNCLKVLVKEKGTKESGVNSIKAKITETINALNDTIQEQLSLQNPNLKKTVSDKTVLQPKFEQRTEVHNESNDYTEGVGKQYVRTVILDSIRESSTKYKVKDGVILTLSSSNCIMEKNINLEFPKFDFFTCENDLNISNKIREEVKKNKLKFMKYIFEGNIEEIIRISGKNKFSHLLLDYCGTFKTYQDEIRTALEEDIIKRYGIITVTLSTRISEKDFNTKNEFESMINKITNDANQRRYKIIKTEPYRDTMSMVTFVVRRML